MSKGVNVKQTVPLRDIIEFHRPYLHLTDEELGHSRFSANMLNETVKADPNSSEILKLTAAFAIRDCYTELSYRN